MPKATKPVKKKHADITRLIAEGKELDGNIKLMTAQREEIKAKIREHARAVNSTTLIGDYDSCAFIDHVETSSIDHEALWVALKRKRNDFFNCVKVNLTITKKIIGTAKYREIATFKTEKFKRVSFGEVEGYGEDKKS